MSKEDDFIQIHLHYHPALRLPLADTPFDWPPPEFIVFDADEANDLREAGPDDPRTELFHRHRYSSLTDEQIAQCPNVARGAEYRYVEPLQ